jgi:hypothetical protein
MAAVADIEDLRIAKDGLDDLQKRFPDAYAAFVEYFNRHKMIGYKNIMKMMLYGKSPESLKE